MKTSLLVFWISALSLLSAAVYASEELACPCPEVTEVIERDVVIFGGGSSGTYAAVRLREDFKKSVIIVEQNNRLGGHANTYVDPTSETTVNFGAVVFENSTIVTRHFSRLNTPLTLIEIDTLVVPPTYADFSANTLLPDHTQTNPALALQKYAQILATNFSYIDDGFSLPSPVPSDLFIPFTEFAAKYGLEDMIQAAFAFGQGVRDLSTIPTIYVIKLLNLRVVRSIGTGFWTPTSGSTQQLYDNAADLLAKDIIYNTTSACVHRHETYVEVVTQSSTPGELPKRIIAKKILVTIPPIITNMAHFDLTPTENELFSSFENVCYGTSLFTSPLLASYLQESLVNSGENTPFNIPVLPSLYGIYPTAEPGLFNVKYFNYSTPTVSSIEEVITRKLADLAPSLAARKNSTSNPDFEPQFVTTEQHCPFELTVSGQEIENGFYAKLNALQGQKRMYLAGATMQAHDSSEIWRQLENIVLPELVKGI